MSDSSSTRCLTLSTVFFVALSQGSLLWSLLELELPYTNIWQQQRDVSLRPRPAPIPTTDDAAYLAGPITTSELHASIRLLSDTRRATSDMGNAIERIGQLNLQVSPRLQSWITIVLNNVPLYS